MPNLINIFSNDPNARGLGLEQVMPPSGTSRFAVPGWNGTGGLFDPGTPEFQAGMLHTVLNQTYSMWADFFNADFAWQNRKPQLPIAPRAGQDLNAYYDRVGLRFFFNTDQATRQMIYTCESADIVAHECGHAVLDAEHPDYWDSLLAETPAFHEAFGDVSAILLALDLPSVRAAILAENDGDLAKSNAVTRLAEQLARGFVNNGFASAVVSADALRDAVNRFRYRDPDTLPGRAPAHKLCSESHSFSRVFSGAFYDMLVAMYEQLRKADATLAPDAALAQARYDAGHLIAQGLLLAPRGDAMFRAIVTAMFNADAQMFEGKYYRAVRKAFVGRRMISAKEADALKSLAGKGRVKTKGLGIASASVGLSSESVIAETKPGQELPKTVARSLGVAGADFVLKTARLRRNATRVLHFESDWSVELKGKELGVARGAVVDVSDAVAVQVDSDGAVMATQLHQFDRTYEKRVHDHVAKLVARNRVHDPREGETVDAEKLITQRQPYFIAYDVQGTKRIRRAFIACG